jgi:hypothetical protein
VPGSLGSGPPAATSLEQPVRKSEFFQLCCARSQCRRRIVSSIGRPSRSDLRRRRQPILDTSLQSLLRDERSWRGFRIRSGASFRAHGCLVLSSTLPVASSLGRRAAPTASGITIVAIGLGVSLYVANNRPSETRQRKEISGKPQPAPISQLLIRIKLFTHNHDRSSLFKAAPASGAT